MFILDVLVKEPASALLWVYHYLAQHYDYLDDIQKALTYIDMAIEHTPTLIELFVTKGRILKVSILFFIKIFVSLFYLYFVTSMLVMFMKPISG